MRSALITLSALLLSATILVAGNGLQNTLLAVRGNLEGFSLLQIGLLLSVYYVGFILGCQLVPRWVKRVGHVRCFTALASIASASALTHALWVDAVAWLLLRGVTGFCLAGLTMIIESWINERATNQNRGRVLAVYRIVDFGALTVGQFLLTLADPQGFVLFALTSILISLCLVPVALSTAVVPQPIQAAKLDLRQLFHTAPLAAAASFAVGAANSAVWAVGPVYVQRLGHGLDTVAVFMSAMIVGGAVSQWPLGLLSDRIDRRRMITVQALVCGVTGALLAALTSSPPWLLMAGGAAFGCAAMPLFGLAAAHANDQAAPGEYVQVSGGLLLLYGVGAVIGPLLAPLFMAVLGPTALFAYTGLVHVGLAGFGAWRVRHGRPVIVEEQGAYVPVPRSTPVVFQLDPRSEPEQAPAAAGTPVAPSAGSDRRRVAPTVD